MLGEYSIFCEHDGLRDGWRAPSVPYLTDAQNRRLEEIRRLRLLWKGKHRKYFLNEARTQFNFDKMRAQGLIQVPYMSINLLKKISNTYADLLLGKDPKLTSEDPAQQEIIDDLSKRSDLYRVFYDAIVQSSWSKEAMVEICIYDAEIYVENRKSDEMFPVGSRNPDGQYSSYLRYEENFPSADAGFLLVTTYTAGKIERHCYQLDKEKKQGDEVGIEQWPCKQPDGSVLAAMEETKIDVPTIVWMGNELDEGEPQSDYGDDLIENQDHLNAAETQLAVVIAKHGNPKMYAKPRLGDNRTGAVETSQGVFYVENKDDIGYVTYNAELTSAITNVDRRQITMAVLSDLTPSLLGLRLSAAPESADKFKLDAIKPMARVTRKAKYVGPFIRTTLDTARALESKTKYVVIEQSASSVAFADPMPVDEQSQATAVSLWRSCNGMSIEDAVAIRVKDPAQAAIEVARIKKEMVAAAPSITMGAGPSGEPGEETPNAERGTSEGKASALNDESANPKPEIQNPNNDNPGDGSPDLTQDNAASNAA